jgi:Yip1 domain
MRCRGCNYELWNLPPGDCPECGKAWRFEDFHFRREFVQFLCPHCDCAYPGEYIASLALPYAFTCTGCQSAIELGQMCARPADGIDGSQAMQLDFVWSDRRQVGRWRAFWRVVGYSLGAPSKIGNTMTQKRGLRGALWFSFLCLISANLNFILFFLVTLLLPIFMGIRSPAPTTSAEIFTTVLGVFAFSVVLVLAQQLFFLVWSLITHALIRMTGRARYAIGHTLSATQFCAGTFIICAIPICGFYFSLISFVWMAVAMVSALAALHKISRWRTAFAVLAPPVVMISVLVWFVYPPVVRFWNNLPSRTPMNFPPMPTNSQPIVAPNTPINTPSSAPTDATEVETDPAATSTTSQPIDAPTANPDPVSADPTSAPTPTQDPAAPNPPKNTSSDSAAILNLTHGI